MKVSFIGTSHAAQHLSRAAAEKGFHLCEPEEAALVFVSEDTPTYADGTRELIDIKRMIAEALKRRAPFAPIVVTSAVPPGFMRGLGIRFAGLYHQAETLRIKDAEERARNPEMIVLGAEDPEETLPDALKEYALAWGCRVFVMTWEEAEFSKMAINVALAYQVDFTNRLAAAARKVGVKWERVAEVLHRDSRIGPRAYLTPGRWQNSSHLVRDWKTLTEIECAK